MMRRRLAVFLWFLAVLLILSAIGVWIWMKLPQDILPDQPNPVVPTKTSPIASTNRDEIINEVNRKLGRYAVQVTLSPPNDSSSFSTWTELTMSAQDTAALKEFAGYLVIEFNKYPLDLVQNSGLTTIGIVRDLQVSGSNRPSVPVPSLNSMVYDAPLEVKGGKDYASSGISHEYWHFLDYKMRGDYRYADVEWAACNPAGFTYGDGGETAYDNPDFKNAFYDRKGFVTEYSTYGIEEDRAEMFAWLMYDPRRVKNLDDSGIDCKIQRLTTIVRELSPQMSF